MKKLMLAAVLLLLAAPATGRVTYTFVDYDTLGYHATDNVTGSNAVGDSVWVDSSAVLNVAPYDYMELQFIATKPPAGEVDSLLVLYVSAYEVLPRYYTDDVSRVEEDSSHVWGTVSTPCDSTVLPWLPNIAMRQAAAAAAAADTVAYNSLDGDADQPASFEIRVRFPVLPLAGEFWRPRAVSVPLVNTLGVPFTAQYAYFKWRTSGGSGDPLQTCIRVVLKGVGR